MLPEERAHGRHAMDSPQDAATMEGSRSGPMTTFHRECATPACGTIGSGAPSTWARRPQESPVRDGRPWGWPEGAAVPARTDAGRRGWKVWAKTEEAAGSRAAKDSNGAATAWAPEPERPVGPTTADAATDSRIAAGARRRRSSAVATACSLVSAMTASSLDTTGVNWVVGAAVTRVVPVWPERHGRLYSTGFATMSRVAAVAGAVEEPPKTAGLREEPPAAH